MNIKLSLLIVILIVGALILAAFTQQKKQEIELREKIVEQRKVYLGMWTHGFWNDGEKELHPEELTSLEAKVGKKMAIAHVYHGWEYLTNPESLDELNKIRENNWTPMVSFNPYFYGDCISTKPLYAAIAEGVCDNTIRSIARNIKSYPGKILLRFAWEMNIETMPWDIHISGSTPQDFIAAWRRIHTIFTEEAVTNARWVFSPGTNDHNKVPYKDYYPGSAYVDWLAIDGYNWGTTQSWSNWRSFDGVFRSSYEEFVALDPEMPIMLAEVNTTDVGGDKAEWYRDMLEEQIPYNYPNIAAIIFYNENRQETEKVNWQIDVTPSTLEAFSTGIASDIYASVFR